MLSTPVPVRPPRVAGSVWAIAIMTIACFGILFGTTAGLVSMGVHEVGALVPIVACGAASILGISYLIIRMLSGIVNSPSRDVPTLQRAKRELQRVDQVQLPAPPDYAPSVTEHTTRIFEERNKT